MNLGRWGITHTLDEVFEAEPIIKRVMNDEGKITKAFIGAPCALAPQSLNLLLHVARL